MTVAELLDALRKPIKRLVRIPEGWWIARVARRLEQEGVCSAQDYAREAQRAQDFSDPELPFLPKEGSLEGYLFPDTYDLPPMTPAKDVIRMQLRTFRRRVTETLTSDNWKRTLTVASLIEAETALPREKPQVAAVIENRLAKKMRLEIDATVLFGIQEWRVLAPGEVRKLRSPYNTYLIPALPPGPINSPSLSSIKAALQPATSSYLFYVALPDKSHLFSTNYDAHRANINKRKAILRQMDQ